jgi:hypothetical protein
VIVTAVQTALCRPAQIILLRHAEKPAARYDADLSERGYQRAQAVVPLLTTKLLFVTNGLPMALFAPRFTVHGHGRRCEETLAPLARQLKLGVQMPVGPEGYAALAKQVLKDPSLNGKTVVICWVHDYLPALAKELGVKSPPAPWKGKVYDRVWVIRYQKRGATLTDVPQHLLPGDSEK